MAVIPAPAVTDMYALLQIIADPTAAKAALDDFAKAQSDASAQLDALRAQAVTNEEEKARIAKANDDLTARQATIDDTERKLASDRIALDNATTSQQRTATAAQAAQDVRDAAQAATKQELDARSAALDKREADITNNAQQTAGWQQQLANDRAAFEAEKAAWQAKTDAIKAAVQGAANG